MTGPAPDPAPAPAWRRFGPWVALAVVVAVALALGSISTSAPTPVQRAAGIASEVRCPGCTSLSAAQSDDPSAATVRAVIRQQVAGGRSDAAIESSLVSRYGPSILLRPSSSGVDALVWVLPVVALAAALGGVGLVLWRRRGLAGGAATAEDRRLVEEALAGRGGSRRAPLGTDPASGAGG